MLSDAGSRSSGADEACGCGGCLQDRKADAGQRRKSDPTGGRDTRDARNRGVIADGGGRRKPKWGVLARGTADDARKIANRERCRERHDDENDEPCGEELVRHHADNDRCRDP